MSKDNQSQSQTSLFTKVVPWATGVGFFAAMFLPLYLRLVAQPDFLKKDVVTLEGTVIDERYVQPTREGGSSSKDTPSKYFFSIDSTTNTRLGIEVIASFEPKVDIESVDAMLTRGTPVRVNCSEITPGNYKAFANEVYIRR